jgi:hypothetical protein
MESVETATPARRTSLTNLIAWLSVCLVVAGWGPDVEPLLRLWWARVGALGLVGAFGLELANRTRSSVIKRSRQKAITKRIQRNVAEETARSTTP